MKSFDERLAEAAQQLAVARYLMHSDPVRGYAALKRAQAILEEVTEEFVTDFDQCHGWKDGKPPEGDEEDSVRENDYAAKILDEAKRQAMREEER